MRDLDLSSFKHSCKQSKQTGGCEHGYSIIGSWRPVYDGFEFLRRTYPQKYDTFYHEGCEDYDLYGTCLHLDETQFEYFEHDGCEDYAKEGKCPHLKDLVMDIMGKSDLTTDDQITAYYKKYLKTRSIVFSHHGCPDYRDNGKCDDLLDLIFEWKHKYNAKMRVIDRGDRRYHPMYHPDCADFTASGSCSHTQDNMLELFTHAGCPDYKRDGKCYHLRDMILHWRNKYRLDYNSSLRSKWYVTRRYSFRTSGSNRWGTWAGAYDPYAAWKRFAVVQQDTNNILDRTQRSFNTLCIRAQNLTNKYNMKLKSYTPDTADTNRLERIRAARERVHGIIRRQDTITHTYKRKYSQGTYTSVTKTSHYRI